MNVFLYQIAVHNSQDTEIWTPVESDDSRR